MEGANIGSGFAEHTFVAIVVAVGIIGDVEGTVDGRDVYFPLVGVAEDVAVFCAEIINAIGTPSGLYSVQLFFPGNLGEACAGGIACGVDGIEIGGGEAMEVDAET